MRGTAPNRTWIVAGGLLAVLACASSPPPGEGSDVCGTSQTAARSRVERVVDDNQSCSTDADCAAIEVHTTCFDTCYRVVNSTGKGAGDRVETLVEGGTHRIVLGRVEAVAVGAGRPLIYWDRSYRAMSHDGA